MTSPGARSIETPVTPGTFVRSSAVLSRVMRPGAPA
ncbi:hypothetical protein SAMN05421835_13261 [Amycolatopsis sacchari]|uniref:Uncharacterized protein n=1 Tax=Amycolatopsis sacchari TaxID=115433 RepID=A0A1I4C8H5_9PSEU|nr:hypothetical protein SAMN05421835_13261 [Amycolatopsis sacchari]